MTTTSILGAPRRTVLVVDDTPDNLTVLADLLKDDYKVKLANGGAKALKLAVSAPQPDLILLDLMMPRLDGWTVAEELAADRRTSDIPVVFLTARATTSDRRRAEELGALGYVLKPFDPVGLAPLVAEVVARCSRGEADELRRERPDDLWPADLQG
jgi:putative two-component system response regulator